MTPRAGTASEVKEIERITKMIEPLLHGREPIIVSAILAELLSMLLAGFQGEDASKVRKELLQAHIELVRKLVPVNERRLLERIRKEAH